MDLPLLSNEYDVKYVRNVSLLPLDGIYTDKADTPAGGDVAQ